jgi:radical SAM superfamily enzyme YgiQ (UPF0313 family)
MQMVTPATDYNKMDIFWKDFVNLKENLYVSDVDMTGFKCLMVYFTVEDDLSKYDYPIALGYMASILRMNNAEVRILIQNIEKYDSEVFSEYDLICFYPMTFLFDRILTYSEKVKKDNPTARLCYFNSDQHQHEMLLCTPHAVNFAETFLRQNPFIDYVLIGEAEKSLLMLCEKLIRKDYNLAGIPSCLYRQQKEIKHSEKPAEPVNFYYLPFASRDYLEKGITPKGFNVFSPRIQSSRGCVSGCSYCVESAANLSASGRKKAWLGRDIIRLVDEIELLSRDFKVVFFNIIDSSFEDPGKKGVERMRLFMNEILSRNIEASLKIHLRAETVDELSDDDLQKMKEAGIDILVVGVESGIERELRSYNKRTTSQKTYENILRLDKFNRFFTILGHMMFSACLTLEELYQKVDYLKSIHRGWDYLNMSNNVLVFRGTAYHEYIKKMNLELPTSSLSAVIPYRYEDARVEYVAKEMGELKQKCPDVIYLNNLLYDAQNIISRHYNKMNKHLWENERYFVQFKENISCVLIDVENVFVKYFTSVVDLASSRWSSEEADLLYSQHIQDYFPYAFNKTKRLIDDFIESHAKAGLCTERVYLKTWMSLINTKANTSQGQLK